MYRFIILLIACLFGTYSVKAQTMEALDRLQDDGYNFWLYSPDSIETDSISPKPLIIFLHGQSICGRNMDKVLRYGTLDALRRGRNIDAFVIAPQNPGGRWNPSKVIDLVDWALINYPIDKDRVYVLGMSLGGFGTINVAAAYPDRFAAAMALCGGGNDPNYENLNKIPLWILHGTADRDVRIRDSEEVVRGMQQAGKPERLIFNRLKGYNHSILARCFYMPQTYDWLFSHSLSDSTRTLCSDYKIVDEDFSIAYNDLTNPTWNKIKYINRLTKESNSYHDPSESYSQIHKVKKGDTLSKIAKKYHTTVKKLCHLNRMKETTTLRIGQKIRVK